jgi:hypothetical protein
MIFLKVQVLLSFSFLLKLGCQELPSQWWLLSKTNHLVWTDITVFKSDIYLFFCEERTSTGKIVKGVLRKFASKEWMRRLSEITSTAKLWAESWLVGSKLKIWRRRAIYPWHRSYRDIVIASVRPAIGLRNAVYLTNVMEHGAKYGIWGPTYHPYSEHLWFQFSNLNQVEAHGPWQEADGQHLTNKGLGNTHRHAKRKVNQRVRFMRRRRKYKKEEKKNICLSRGPGPGRLYSCENWNIGRPWRPSTGINPPNGRRLVLKVLEP